jgi:D-aminopeptidase
MTKSEARPRARDLGIKIGSLPPGPLNAITDIAGVRVGHCTVWEGDISGTYGSGPARTGVTAIVPPGDYFGERLYAGCSVLNGCGEIIGITNLNELGTLDTPILLTNSMSIGIVYHATARYLCAHDERIGRSDVTMPVVGECDDSYLNDATVFHVREEHVLQALESASSGPVVEGTVGSATGLHCFDFKGGIGTSSRQLPDQFGGYTVGVLVNTNFGKRHNLSIAGVPVGREIQDLMPGEAGNDKPAEGSCIVVVATNAPLHPLGLQRLARRAGLGIARTGSTAHNGSGEIFLAFSTGVRIPRLLTKIEMPISLVPESSQSLNVLFDATVEATEEAVLNALFRATTVSGIDGHILHELPIERTQNILHKYGRL